MGAEMPQRVAMPCDDQFEGGFVLHLDRGRPVEQILFRCLRFAKPAVLPSQHPHRVGRLPGAAVLLDEPGSNVHPHVVRDRLGVLAAQAERFEEALPDRRYANPELAHPVIDDRFGDGRMRGRLGLDDLQRPDARALFTPRAQKQPAIARRSEQHHTCPGQIGVLVEVAGDADRMLQDGAVDVIVGIDVDAAHEMDELSRPRQVVTAGSVQGLTNQLEGHSNFPVPEER